MSKTRPPVLPEMYTGEKCWYQWVDHFESVADVCSWNAEKKLQWLRVQLSGRAWTTFACLPEASRNDYERAKEALKNWFEPESKKTLYQTRLQTRLKKKDEGWMEFGEDLMFLADKAYPELTVEARECFASNQYFTKLTDPQIAFAVRHTKPTTIDAAVQATLEMESYHKTISRKGCSAG